MSLVNYGDAMIFLKLKTRWHSMITVNSSSIQMHINTMQVFFTLWRAKIDSYFFFFNAKIDSNLKLLIVQLARIHLNINHFTFN